ncbi:hypothetical protein AAG906_008868 [Vitis piasezkii]
MVRQPPVVARPLEGTSSYEEVRREDDEILRQLQSTQARISIWSLLTFSSTHRDTLIRALTQIRVETTTTLERLIHMVTAGRATSIVFSDDDLPSKGSGHTRPLYISIGCSARQVSFVLLDNGSTLNVCPLTTAIALGYAPSNFKLGPFLIPFIKSHSDDDLFLTGFTFDEVQTLEMEDFYRDFVAMSLDQHGSIVVLDMMRSMFYLPVMGLGRRQHGPSEFMAIPDHDVPFRLEFIPTETNYRYIARVRKEIVRARLTHTPFDYPVRPYTMSLADYFMRASEPQTHADRIIGELSTTQEAQL